MAKEIERQFALDGEPTSEQIITELMRLNNETGFTGEITMKYTEDQYTSYLYTGPVQVRVRKIVRGNRKPIYRLTIKGGYEKRTTRTEVETNITEEQYEEILSIIGNDVEPIRKRCVILRVGKKGRDINISTVDPGKDTSFTFAEVEFDSEKEAEEFEWPLKGIKAYDVTGRTGVNPGKSMSMTEYWEKVHLSKA